MKGKNGWRWLLLITLLVVVFGNPTLREWTSAVREWSMNEQSVLSMTEQLKEADREQQIRQQIIEAAKRLDQPPIDARLDVVWKAIPGYEGRVIDVEQTLQATLTSGGPIVPIFKQVEPRVQLHHLGAHPVYKGNASKPMAGLMINVAWGNEHLVPMLETLRKEQVKATFFLDGSWLNQNHDLAKQIVAEGHEIGNHAYSHKDMSKLTSGQASQEISRTETLIKDVLGVSSSWFAPPSGDYSQQTVEIAHKQGMGTVLWTLDTIDWKNPGAAAIIKKIDSRIEPGFLILMHPTTSSRDALGQMIEVIRKHGLTPGSVSQVLSSKRLPEG